MRLAGTTATAPTFSPPDGTGRSPSAAAGTAPGITGIHRYTHGTGSRAAGTCVVQLRCLYFRGVRTNTPSHIVVRSDHWVSIRSLLHRSNGMNMPLVRAAHPRVHRMRCAVPKSPPCACSIQVGQEQRNLPSKLFSARPRVGVQDCSWRGEQDVRWHRERLYIPSQLLLERSHQRHLL